MGPCRKCGKWHCGCWDAELLAAIRQQKADAIQEHRALKAKSDPSFQRFMRAACGR